MRVLGALLFVLPFVSPAQILRIEAGTGDPMVLRFDQAFIARNHVKGISGQAHVKRDNEPMRARSECTQYRFSPDGRLTYNNTSYGRPGSGSDTASITYNYDARGFLTEQLRNDLNGYYALRDEVDPEGRPVRETYVRIENLGTDRYLLIPGTLTTISDERFTYTTVNDTAVRKTYLNDRGLPYREQTFCKDRYGYLRAVHDRYVITERRGLITFSYDEKGRLAERVEQADLREQHIIRHTWRYDAAGNPITCDTWHDAQQTRHTEYLYEELTMLLKATLTKELGTGMINIMRYTTER